jgi:formylmethanofuran dehydrogenase subunit E
MRMMDFGKVAATFVDTGAGDAVRIYPHPESRSRAKAAAPEARDRWHAQLLGYQRLADDQLLIADPVVLTVDLEALISHAGARAVCVACGEEIINRREILRGDDCLCRACAGEAYYTPEPCLPIADARSSRPMPADLARLTEARI